MEKEKDVEDVIDLSVKGGNVETLNTYLLSIQDNSGAFSQKTLSTLFKLLKRNGKHEDKVLHLNCALSCFQHFLELDAGPDKWQPFAEDVSKLCELVFTISVMFLKDEVLIKKLGGIVSEMAERVDCMADPLLRYMLEVLLATASTLGLSISTRLLVLFAAATVLQKSSRHTRCEILSREAILSHLVVLSNYLLVCGDYEMQVSVMEVLARCRLFLNGPRVDDQCLLFTEYPRAHLMFENHKFINFDPECRLFLNDVNNGLGDKRLVYSVSCMVVTSEKSRFKKPNDPDYTEFWVDFNLETRSVSFYHSSTAEDSWDLMKVDEEVVVCALAKNSACKSRGGEIIAAVKIELILKHDRNNQHLPKLLKLYLHKSTEFQKMEKMIIQRIFRDKYKSELTYTDLSQPNPMTALLSQPVPSNFARRVSSYSFAEMESVLSNELEGEQESVGLGIVEPTPPLPSTTTPSKLNSSKTSALEPKTDSAMVSSSGESQINSGDSDSFARYIIEGKKQEIPHQVVVDDNLLKRVEKKTEEKGSESKNCGLKHKQGEEELEEMHNEIKKSSRKELAFEMNDELNSKIKLSPDNSRIGRPEVSRSQSGGGSRVSDKSKSADKQLGSNSRKRRLYSNENIDTKDIVLSSQETGLSVEIPAYKLRKQASIREPHDGENDDEKNISYSNISNRKKTKSDVVQNDNIYVDLKESDQQLSEVDQCMKVTRKNIEPSPIKYFKSLNNKLLALNKTPEGTKTSNIFPEHTVYSDFSSLRKTYSKPKSKKVKRVRVMQISSDSDSDYVPPVKVSSTGTPSRQGVKRVRNNVNSEMFVNKLTKHRMDPTRDVKVANEKDLEPIVLEDPESEPREIDVPTTSIVTSVVLKKAIKGKKGSGENKKVVREKKTTNKGRKPAPTRQLRGGKVVDLAVDNDDVGECLDVVNYKPPETDTPEDEDFAWEMFNCPMPQDKSQLQTTFKINEVVQFNRHCLKDAECRLQKLQSLALKEREMNYATFDFKVQARCTSINNHCQKLETLSKNLNKIKTMLDSAYNLQKEIGAQIQADAAQLEEAKQDLIKNVAKIEKSESANIASVFQGMGRRLTNLVYSFFQKNPTKKALPN